MSFAVNQLIGFGARRAAAGGVETLVDRTTGTAFGNMNSAGGADLAFAFDGTTSQAHTSSAGATSATGYIGKSYGAGKRISKIETYPSNNLGYWYNESGGTGAFHLYGKNGAPASGTDGTLLGSLTGQADTTSGFKTVTNTIDTVSTFTHIWLYMDSTGATSSTFVFCAELKIYELI